ncbi:hypothetical protein lerEdw1_015995 [Lerista edwardsae]|nr:hypothetical protein lerEdw1_015995 [Lerista edwardsae]
MAAKLPSIAHNAEALGCPRPPAWTSTHWRLCQPSCRHVFLLLLLHPALLAAAQTRKPSLPPVVNDTPFLVAWNAPTARCSASFEVPLHLEAYGILVNSQEAFMGGNITIFYYDQLGLYPYYLNTTVPAMAVNGGCPQNASLTKHLDKMAKDISAAMPSDPFAGLAVIDWENWRPLWIRNWDKKNVYRNMSLLLVRQRNPLVSDSQIETQAKFEFETAARVFMSETLRLARSLRPNGWWGYYLFPDCYNYHYLDGFEDFTGHCPLLEEQRNDELSWLWENSKALYPSIYLEEVLRASPQGKRFVWAKVGEALRVAELPSAPHALPVFVYARPFYTYTLKELTETNCVKIRDYLISTLGPYILNVTTAAKLCSQVICNNRGRCIRRRMASDTYLHLSPDSFRIETHIDGDQPRVTVRGTLSQRQKAKLREEFTCNCYQSWTGESCRSWGRGLRLRTQDGCVTVVVLSALLAWLL